MQGLWPLSDYGNITNGKILINKLKVIYACQLVA